MVNGTKEINQKINRTKFLRFQVTALTATCVDFLMTVFFKEAAGLHYTSAVACGAACGAITAFTINRIWVFRALESHPGIQAIKYFAVASGSILLNTSGTYFFTELFQTPYLISKAVVALFIGFTYSYYFSKRFVFYA